MSEEEIKEIKRKINALGQREENRFLMFERKIAELDTKFQEVNELILSHTCRDVGNVPICPLDVKKLNKITTHEVQLKKLEEQMEIKTDVIYDLLKKTGYIPSILVMNEINGRLEKLETQIKKCVDFDLYKVDIDFDLGQHIKLNDPIAENRIVLKALIATEIAHYTEMIIQLQKLEPDHFQIKDLKRRIEDWKQLGKRLSQGKPVASDGLIPITKVDTPPISDPPNELHIGSSWDVSTSEYENIVPTCKNCGKELLKIENKFECKNCGWEYNNNLKYTGRIYPDYPTYEELRWIAQPIFEKFDRADLISFTNKYKEEEE